MAKQIQEVGAEHFILATDFGVYTLPPPVEGMREFISCMLDLELAEDEIRLMTSINPAKLLGID
jgi:hypothetical protein